MKSIYKEPTLYLVLIILFTPMAFLLMPLVAALIAIGAVALLIISWKTTLHHK